MGAPKGHVTLYVKAWRERLWLTQEELATRAGISIFTVRHAEYGKPVRAPAVRKLAEALGTTPEMLCYGEAEKVGA